MAYSIPTQNPQFQHQLGYQFANKSPQNQRSSGNNDSGYKGIPGDVEHVPLKSQGKLASSNKFVNSKTSVLLKGCLNQKQYMNKLLSNPSRKNTREKASMNRLPDII